MDLSLKIKLLKKIHFIINPVAGKGNNSLSYKHLESIFNKEQYTVVIKESSYKNHALKLTEASITEGANIIVACGGDGTVNEVASCLVNQNNILLGILPIGSGNGLASNLNIPKNINKALHLLKTESSITIDIGLINDRFFFSNCGIGFDAQVIKDYEASKRRNLISYVLAYFKTVFKKFKVDEYKVEINNKIIQFKPFMIFTSNSNELGYSISLTPQSSLQDGLLDILLVSKIGVFKVLLLTVLMLLKKHTILKEIQQLQTNKLTVTQINSSEIEAQIDGEFHLIKNNVATISIIKKKLKVISKINLN